MSKNQAVVFIALDIMAAFVLGVTLAKTLEQPGRDTKLATALCDYAYETNNKELCIHIQNTMNYEYLCKNDRCWVEAK